MPSPTDGWRRRGDALIRDFQFRDFPEALAFVNLVGTTAVDYQRRPDLAISGFNRVRVTVANPHHAGLTAAECRLAARVDAAVALDRSSGASETAYLTR